MAPARSAHLYRQAQIYGREGVDLDRATMADWVGKAAGLLRPLVEAIAAHVMDADDTPVPVLDPGRGRTKTGRLWVYLRDDRPHAGYCLLATLALRDLA
jgi:transposase